MQFSNKQLRIMLRAVHLLGMPVLGVLLYTPWGNNPTVIFTIQAIVFPAFMLTGILMWQMPRLSRLLKHKPIKKQQLV